MNMEHFIWFYLFHEISFYSDLLLVDSSVFKFLDSRKINNYLLKLSTFFQNMYFFYGFEDFCFFSLFNLEKVLVLVLLLVEKLVPVVVYENCLLIVYCRGATVL
ncbi:hypothetical protein Droror1_Dr00006342 [Drosera rotundifolia]